MLRKEKKEKKRNSKIVSKEISKRGLINELKMLQTFTEF